MNNFKLLVLSIASLYTGISFGISYANFYNKTPYDLTNIEITWKNCANDTYTVFKPNETKAVSWTFGSCILKSVTFTFNDVVYTYTYKKNNKITGGDTLSYYITVDNDTKEPVVKGIIQNAGSGFSRGYTKTLPTYTGSPQKK